MREEEVSLAATIVETERLKITEERKTMTDDFKAKMETLNKRFAEWKRYEEDL